MRQLHQLTMDDLWIFDLPCVFYTSLTTVTSVSIIYWILFVIFLIGLTTVIPWFIYLVKMAARQATILSYLMRSAPKVDPKQHGGQLIAKVFKSHGVENVFTLSGGHISPILVGAEQLGR